MFSKIVDQKASKLKFNVDGYLTNDKKRQQSQFQNSTGARREPTVANPVVTPPINSVSPVSKPPDPQIKSITMQGKTYQNTYVNVRSIKKQKQIHIYFNQQNSKFKLQIKVIPENSFQVRRNLQKGKNKLQAKEFLNFNSKRHKRRNLSKNREALNPSGCSWLKQKIKGSSQQWPTNSIQKMCLIAEDQIKNFEQKVTQEKHVAVPQLAEQDRGDDEVVKFTMPTQQQLNQTQKFRKSIKDMKQDEKLYIISDIFKVKKEYEDLDRKKLKCPVFSCQKNYRQISQLKTHIKKSHVQLNKHGIQVTQFGTFEYSSKALDLALYLGTHIYKQGKIFPGQIKKIIKKMKTKQPIE